MKNLLSSYPLFMQQSHLRCPLFQGNTILILGREYLNKGNYTLYTTMVNLLDFKMIFSWKPRSKRNFSVYWDNIHALPSR